MAIVGVNTEANRDFTFEDDTKDPTVWQLGTLSSRALGVLMDQSAVFAANTKDVENMKMDFKGSQAAYSICQFGLRGWTNFKTEDGGQIPFEQIKKCLPGTSIEMPAVPDALMEMLPLERLRILSDKIQRQNEVTADEGKTSGA